MTTYSNTPITYVSTKGGITIVAIASNSANGPNQDCREVWVQAAISDSRYINVGLSSAVTSIKGITLPKPAAVAVVSAAGQALNALRIPIDNLNKLWFYGTVNSDSIAFMWRN